MELILPDCQTPPSSYRADPHSQPTIGLGCVAYPSPSDAAPRWSYTTPMLNRVEFVIEAGGETLTGGTFSDAGITCHKACTLDAGPALNCPVSALVRYSGPLLPGKEHKITWTNSGRKYGLPPSVTFMVAAFSAVDAGGATDSGRATNAATDGATVTATADSATDTGTTTTATDPSSPGTPPDAGAATTDTPISAGPTTGTDGDAGAATKEQSSSCSCALGARRRGWSMILLLVAFFGLTHRRITSAERRRPGAPTR